ncbi:MAG: diguanylate cyclase [Cellvibrionaceae bacterium]|nr:diguanylate cyclase [Cellvibrionaceae bacterium]
MGSSQQDYKEKYLDLLDRQERAEQRFSDQQETLKRALSRLSVAAGGLDEELDKRLDELRRQLRASEPKPLNPLVKRLEDSVLAFDGRRDQRSANSLRSLIEISEQLQSISRDKQAEKGLKQFRKSLKKRVELQHQYAAMLDELAQLQGKVIASVSSDPSGFWDKLRNKRTLAEPLADAAEAEASLPEPQQAAELQAVELETPEPIELGADAIGAEPARTEAPTELEGQFLSRAELNNELEANFDRPRHEPAFSRISNHITRVLTDLLQNLEPEPCVAAKAVRAQNRIARGLNWYELVPTLEDIRDLILQAFWAAENNFQQYLLGVNAELNAIEEALGLVSASEAQRCESNQVLYQQMDTELQVMEQAVTDASSVEQLQQQLGRQLSGIRAALGEHRQANEGGELQQQLEQLQQQLQTMEAEAAQTQADLAEAQAQAHTDALTGLPNREAYNQRAHLELERCRRYGQNLVLAVCDVDHFKQFNDNYGHQVGDRVLKLIARAISQRLRSVDFIGRYGGEEFVILLPDTESEGALGLLNQIRELIAKAPLRFKDEPVQLTVSMGLAALAPGQGVEELFARADKALYQAKSDGRNRCHLAT